LFSLQYQKNTIYQAQSDVKIHLINILILNNKILMAFFCRRNVKIGWTIGIFLDLIPSKGTAHRAAKNRQDKDKPGNSMECGSGCSGSVALKSLFAISFPFRRCAGPVFGRVRYLVDGCFARRAELSFRAGSC